MKTDHSSLPSCHQRHAALIVGIVAGFAFLAGLGLAFGVI